MSDEILSTYAGSAVAMRPKGAELGGGIEFHADERLLVGNGRECKLEPKASELLIFLLAQKNVPVSREALLDEVWGESGSDEALTQAISRLRRAFKELGGQPNSIETVPRVGYRLVDPVNFPTIVPVSVTPAQEAETVYAPGQHRFSARLTHAVAFAAGLATGAAAVLLAILIWFTPVTENVEIRMGPDGQIISDQP